MEESTSVDETELQITNSAPLKLSLPSVLIPFPTKSQNNGDDIPDLARTVPSPSTSSTETKPHQEMITSPSVSQSTSTSLSGHPTSKVPSTLPTSESLPAPNSTPILRSVNHGMSRANKGYRYSLDASIASMSMPSLLPTELAGPRGAVNSSAYLNPNGARTSSSQGGSRYKENSGQKVSFESDRDSFLTMPSVGQAFSQMGRRSDPPLPSLALRSPAHPERPRSRKSSEPRIDSRSPSHSRSRATSPLRIFQQWSAGLHRNHRTVVEERFIPVDPFEKKSRFRSKACFTPSDSDIESVITPSTTCSCNDLLPISSVRTLLSDISTFLLDTLPRQLYLNFLLRLPAMYFSRVARVFEDAEVSRPDIQRMIDAGRGSIGPFTDFTGRDQGVDPAHSHASYPPRGTANPGAVAGIGITAHVSAAPASVTNVPLPFPEEWTPALASPALIRFKHSWEFFIDSLLREWKTLNVVSALLASAILTTFQVPEAASDPITRTAAFLSLICALMSLTYGCIYIVRFGTMRSMYRASRWAEEARKDDTLIWWNVWVLLAMPAVWMAWSMLLFLTAILSFVWRSGSVNDPQERDQLSAKVALGPRILVTAILLLGMVYLALIVRTLKRYGTPGGARGILMAGNASRTTGGDEHGSRDATRSEKEANATPERRGRERTRRETKCKNGPVMKSMPVGTVRGGGKKTQVEEIAGLFHGNDSGIEMNLTAQATHD